MRGSIRASPRFASTPSRATTQLELLVEDNGKKGCNVVLSVHHQIRPEAVLELGYRRPTSRVWVSQALLGFACPFPLTRRRT